MLVQGGTTTVWTTALTAFYEEHVPERQVVVTVNRVIDALFWMVDRIKADPPPEVAAIRQWRRREVGDGRASERRAAAMLIHSASSRIQTTMGGSFG